jgi:hypothetical protein
MGEQPVKLRACQLRAGIGDPLQCAQILCLHGPPGVQVTGTLAQPSSRSSCSSSMSHDESEPGSRDLEALADEGNEKALDRLVDLADAHTAYLHRRCTQQKP